MNLAKVLGTATATALVGYGLNGDTAHQAGIAVCAAGLVVADLVLDWISKRGQK